MTDGSEGEILRAGIHGAGMVSAVCTAMGGTTISYLLRDEFTTDRAAGAVNGTAAEPGPGTRTVVDVENKLSISGGQACFTPQVTPVFGEEYLSYGNIARESGRTYLFQATFALDGENKMGFGAAGSPNSDSFYPRAAGNFRVYIGAVSIPVAIYAAATEYKLAGTLRNAGAYFFIRGGVFTNWTLLWIDTVNVDTPAAISISDYSHTVDVDYLRVPDVLWLPTPLAYDTFTRANGALGTSEAVGPDAQAVTARTWNNRVGTTQISTNTASASALVGGIAIATVDCGATDVLHDAELTRVAGNIGIVLRYADADNYVYAYHDGTNAVLVKRVATVETTVITAVTAYAAGAVMRVICEGTSFALYYNNAKIGATSVIGDAGLQTGTEVGLYSSNVGNSQDDMTTFPRGTGNEYAQLDRY